MQAAGVYGSPDPEVVRELDRVKDDVNLLMKAVLPEAARHDLTPLQNALTALESIYGRLPVIPEDDSESPEDARARAEFELERLRCKQVMDQVKARLQFERERSMEYPRDRTEISGVFRGSLANALLQKGRLFGQETAAGINLWKVQAAPEDPDLQSSGRRLNFRIQLRCLFCKHDLPHNSVMFMCGACKKAPYCDPHCYGFDAAVHSAVCRPDHAGGGAGGA